MPAIELRNTSGDGDWLLAIMLFPQDATRRNSFCAVQWAEREVKIRNSVGYVEVMNNALLDLLDAPSKEAIKLEVSDASKRGIVAGDFLSMIYAMHSFPGDFAEPSTRKAIEMMRAFAKVTPWGDGSKLPTSETHIRECVVAFRSVAHLWAAFRLLQAFPIRPGKEIFTSAQAVDDLLAVAGTVQDFGLEFVPKRARPPEPLLSIDSIWSVPTERRLIPPWSKAPDFLVEVARKYKAKVGRTR